ncbi:MAG: CheR family methyltransferase [Planctomycetota bacterium]|jgi:chemotaxis protein methyltransferase CheR
MRATPAEIEFVCDVLQRASGVVLGQEKAYLVRSLLTPLAHQEADGSLTAIVERLRAEPGGPLEQEVVETLLNNETWFFRNHHLFAALRHEMLPALQASGRRPLRIWSAACSSGQEPYSIAIVVHEHFPRLWEQTEIYATDLSNRMLARAGQGLFRQLEVNRGLPAPMLVRYFEEEGADWRIRRPLRDRIAYGQLNLTGEWPELPEMDLIFLRNVLLYFDEPTRQEVLEQARKVLRPDGYLVLGAAEATFPLRESFEVHSCGEAAYYRARALEV